MIYNSFLLGLMLFITIFCAQIQYTTIQKSAVELRRKKLVYAWHLELWSLDSIQLPNFKALKKTTACLRLKSICLFVASAQELL